MAEVLETDLFYVERDGTSYQTPGSNMAELLDDDLMLVERDGTCYKATGEEIKDSLGGGGTVVYGSIDQPTVLGPQQQEINGGTVYLKSDEIIALGAGGSTTCQTDTISSVSNYEGNVWTNSPVPLDSGSLANVIDGNLSTRAVLGGQNETDYQYGIFVDIQSLLGNYSGALYNVNNRAGSSNHYYGYVIFDDDTESPKVDIYAGTADLSFTPIYTPNGKNVKTVVLTAVSGRTPASITEGISTAEDASTLIVADWVNEGYKLTFPSDQGFSCFKRGDVVQGQPQVTTIWSDTPNWSGSAGGVLTSQTLAFNGAAGATSWVNGEFIKWTCPENILATSVLVDINSSAGDETVELVTNKGTYTASTETYDTAGIVGGSGYAAKFTLSGPEQIISVKNTQPRDNTAVYILKVILDGDELIDNVPYPSQPGVKITDIDDSDPYTIVVDGGSWVTGDSVLLGAVLNEYFINSSFTSSDVSGLTYDQDVTSGFTLPVSNSFIVKDAATGIDCDQQYHIYTSSDGVNWTRTIEAIPAGTITNNVVAPYIAIVSDQEVSMEITADPEGDTELVKETSYDTTISCASDKDLNNCFSGQSVMTNGDAGPYTQTPYLVTSDTIVDVETAPAAQFIKYAIADRDYQVGYSNQSGATFDQTWNVGDTLTISDYIIIDTTSISAGCDLTPVSSDAANSYSDDLFNWTQGAQSTGSSTFTEGRYYWIQSPPVGYGGGLTLTSTSASKQATLTFASNQNLENFRLGDVVQSSLNQTENWSSGTVTGDPYTTNTWDKAFNTITNTGVFTYTTSSTTLTLPSPTTWTSSFEVYAIKYGGTLLVNDIDVGSLLSGVAGWVDLTSLVGSSGTLTSLTVSDVNTNYTMLSIVKLDGKILADQDITDPDTASILSLDSANKQMEVSGGDWNNFNDSKVWSALPGPDESEKPIAVCYDGTIYQNSVGSNYYFETKDFEITGFNTPASIVSITPASGNSGVTECLFSVNNGIKKSATFSNNGNTEPAVEFNVSGQLDSIQFFMGPTPEQDLGVGFWNIYVDGKLLVDQGIPGIGENNVTYQTKGGKGNVVGVSGNDIHLNTSADPDERWIVNQGFSVAGPTCLSEPTLTADIELTSSPFVVTPTNPNLNPGILPGNGLFIWTINGVEYPGVNVNPWQPGFLQTDTLYTVSVRQKDSAGTYTESPESVNFSFTTGEALNLYSLFQTEIDAYKLTL